MAVLTSGIVDYQKPDRSRASSSIQDAADVLLHVQTTHISYTEISKPQQWYYASAFQNRGITPRQLLKEPRELNMQSPGYNYVSA